MAPTDRRLGEPLPHQQPNQPPTHPKAPKLSEKEHSSINLLSGISHSFPWLSQTLGQVIDVLLSIPPVSEDPLTCMA